MPPFTPLRASPQVSPECRPRKAIPNLSSFDVTVSSAASSTSAALSNLSPKDVRLIDEIIERSPPSATTFLTVFKAYNEVLAERNMDAANDVVYYKILLKLGVVKGNDWGTKWSTVKSQLGYDVADSAAEEEPSQPLLRGPHMLATGVGGARRTGSPERRQSLQSLMRLRTAALHQVHADEPLHSFGDSVSAQSYSESYTEATETETEGQTQTQSDATEEQDLEDIAGSYSSPRTLITGGRAYETKENALELSTDAVSYPPLPSIDQFLPVQAKRVVAQPKLNLRLDHDTPVQPSPRPLSRLRLRHELPHNHEPRTNLHAPTGSPLPVHMPVSRSRLKPGAIEDASFDEESNWKKIKLARDEKYADSFRKDAQIRHCWMIWKRALQRFTSMNRQGDVKRKEQLLRSYIVRWRSRHSERQEKYSQFGRKHDLRLMTNAFVMWKRKEKEKQVIRWKEDMKKKMSFIRANRDNRYREDAWLKWRMRHRAEVIQLQFDRRLCSRILKRWKDGLAKYYEMAATANEFDQMTEQNRAVGMWDFWKSQTNLRGMENMMRERVNLRIKAVTFESWRQKLSEKRDADLFHDHYVVKHFFSVWKRSLNKLKSLERKADKYQNRQNGFLLRALIHVWATRERGVLMDRTVKVRNLHNVWLMWKARLHKRLAIEEQAISFSKRPSSALVRAAFTRWFQTMRTRKTLLMQAARYDEDLLMHRTLLVWRVQLRVKLKKMKHARVARKYLLLRQVWNKWRDMLEEKKRQQMLYDLENRILRRFFAKWSATASRQLYHRRALQQFEAKIKTRLSAAFLTIWTNRVISIRLRELDILEQRDGRYLRSCFAKWKSVAKRHADGLRLMQSYQLVKREEILRRMFSRWLSLAKTVRRRRLLLQEREEDMNLAVTERAWDQWRERFRAERLRPLEAAFHIQMQKTKLYQTFIIWHSKTKSLPAIQLFALRTKGKCWRAWREAMPKALQARKARIHDRDKLLAHALDKWTQAYRMKIALKAVARARYLRLPSGAPRQSLPLSSALSGILRSSHSAASTKTTRPLSPSTVGQTTRTELEEVDNDSDPASSVARRRRRSSGMKLTTKTLKSDEDRESLSGKKGDLWHELRRARKPLSAQRT